MLHTFYLQHIQVDCNKVLPQIPISLLVLRTEAGVAKLMLVPNLYLSQVNKRRIYPLSWKHWWNWVACKLLTFGPDFVTPNQIGGKTSPCSAFFFTQFQTAGPCHLWEETKAYPWCPQLQCERHWSAALGKQAVHAAQSGVCDGCSNWSFHE